MKTFPTKPNSLHSGAVQFLNTSSSSVSTIGRGSANVIFLNSKLADTFNPDWFVEFTKIWFGEIPITCMNLILLVTEMFEVKLIDPVVEFTTIDIAGKVCCMTIVYYCVSITIIIKSISLESIIFRWLNTSNY